MSPRSLATLATLVSLLAPAATACGPAPSPTPSPNPSASGSAQTPNPARPGAAPSRPADGASAWKTQGTIARGITSGPHALFVRDAYTAFTAGNAGEILKTTDGGASAMRMDTDGVTDALYGITFSDTRTGWAVGELGRVLRTRDGGDTWQPVELFDGDDLRLRLHLTDVTASGPFMCMVGWYGLIAVSRDAGDSWTILSTDLPNLHHATLPEPGHGWIVGDGGTILVTEDGLHWSYQPSNVKENLNGVYFRPNDARNGWIVGDHGTVLHTTNGVEWIPIHVGTTAQLRAVQFADENHGWIVGESGTIVTTSDSGQTWTPQTGSTMVPLEAVGMASPSEGWVVGADPGRNAALGIILHTSSGGR